MASCILGTDGVTYIYTGDDGIIKYIPPDQLNLDYVYIQGEFPELF